MLSVIMTSLLLLFRTHMAYCYSHGCSWRWCNQRSRRFPSEQLWSDRLWQMKKKGIFESFGHGILYSRCPNYCFCMSCVWFQKFMLYYWKQLSQLSIFVHGNVVLNLFLGRFSCRFPTSHGCSSPAGSICWYTHLCL